MPYRSKDSRIYVGNLPPDVRSKDVQDLFHKFGKITFLDLKIRRNPYAFVEFDDARDAEDAVKSRNKYDYDGYRLRVEFPYSRSSKSVAPYRHGDTSSDRHTSATAPVRSDYRVIISGLPATGSWQDLKDHMREAGEVCFADVYKSGTGVVEFTRYSDVNFALQHLDSSRFRSHEGEVSYIRVTEDRLPDKPENMRSRKRSYSPRYRSSPTYSPIRKRSSARSRSSSRSRSRSR